MFFKELQTKALMGKKFILPGGSQGIYKICGVMNTGRSKKAIYTASCTKQ